MKRILTIGFIAALVAVMAMAAFASMAMAATCPTLTFTAPMAEANPSVTVAPGQSVQITVASDTSAAYLVYSSWGGGDWGELDPTPYTFSITPPSTPGTYYEYFVPAQDGCTSNQVTINVENAPTVRNYLWTWYDNVGGDNWILMSNPASAAAPLNFQLSIGGSDKALPNGGAVGPGQTITPRYGIMGGPVTASSLTGDKGIVSQRILWPKGGNSLEEVLGTDESNLSNHFYWTWYDQQSSGMTDWVLVANPNDQAIYYEITIAGQDPGPGSKGYINGHDKVTPTFSGKMGGPVEVQAWKDNSKTTPVNVMASQRVLSNGGSAFNEVPGIPSSQLSSNNDYLWTWYDDVGGRDWLLVANTSGSPIQYTVKIGGVVMPGYDHRTLAGNAIETPRFGVMNGPVEVINDTANGALLASQRVLWGPSFEEVPGYPTGQLSPIYHWTWYDQAEGPGVTNWVLIANPSNDAVNYQVLIGGTVKAQGSIPANGRVTPSGLGIGGPVEVKSCSAAFTGPGQCPDSSPPNVMASQRVLWNGYFNEVLGTVLN